MKRFGSQQNEEFFVKHCDHIIRNDLSIEDMQYQTEVIINSIKERMYGSKEKKT